MLGTDHIARKREADEQEQKARRKAEEQQQRAREECEEREHHELEIKRLDRTAENEQAGSRATKSSAVKAFRKNSRSLSKYENIYDYS